MEPSACSFRPLDATEEEETIWQLDGTLVRMAGCTKKPTHTHMNIFTSQAEHTRASGALQIECTVQMALCMPCTCACEPIACCNHDRVLKEEDAAKLSSCMI